MITAILIIALLIFTAYAFFLIGAWYMIEVNTEEVPKLQETKIRYDKGLCKNGHVILRQSTHILDNEDGTRDMITINHN